MTCLFVKCSKISHIVKLCEMLRRWRARAASSAAAALSPSRRAIPPDVPAGHVAVCVGSNSKRFVVRAAHLNHPAFRRLLAQAEDEYGFARPGPLAIPCDEALFEELLRHLNCSSGSSRFASLDGHQKGVSSSSSCCHAGERGGWKESLPLLQGLAEKSAAW